jgi:hypothetical protein
MAMVKPRSWIIFFECYGEVAVCGERGNVSTGWVDEAEGASREVEYSCGLTKDPEIVAVEMDWVVESVVIVSIYFWSSRARKGGWPTRFRCYLG